MSNVCAPHTLKELIETKEFRLLPCAVWRTVQTNTDLSVEARFLWTVLWELCAPNQKFEKTLTWGFLSKRVGKSESTIRRWSRQLQKFGFLEITERKKTDGSQLPSIFRIGIPVLEARKAQLMFPNRKVRETVQEQAEYKKQEPTTVVSEIKDEEPKPQTSVTAQPEPYRGPEIVTAIQKPRQGKSRTGFNNSEDSKTKSGAPDSVGKAAESLIERLKRMQKAAQARTANDQGEGNSSVADDSFKRLQESRERAAKLLEETRAKERAAIFAQKGVANVTPKTELEKENNNNLRHCGARLRLWIQQQIETRKVKTPGAVERYVEEIAVSIEKGAFKNFPLTKALNVALKLIREGTWSTPRYR